MRPTDVSTNTKDSLLYVKVIHRTPAIGPALRAVELAPSDPVTQNQPETVRTHARPRTSFSTMSSNRRYNEEEVQEILRRATETSHTTDRAPATTEGMSLGELQEIGREVGIDAALISQAAASLDRPSPAPAATRSFLGTTIGVGRTVHIDRPLSDAEWHRLVLDLRETFDARGKLREEGSFRQWTNGNLQALLEPTDSGARLRLSTLKSDARPVMMMGLGLTLFSILLVVGAVIGLAGDPDVFGESLILALAGIVLLATQRVRLPRWAETRELQMEGIIARLTSGMEDGDAGQSQDD